MHACVYMCVYVCMHVYMYACMYVCMYVLLFNWFIYLCFAGRIIEVAEGEGCTQPMYFLLAQLHYHGTTTHSCSATTSYVRGNVCNILNQEDNSGETSEIGMYSKSLVHTYLHSAFFQLI